MKVAKEAAPDNDTKQEPITSEESTVAEPPKETVVTEPPKAVNVAQEVPNQDKDKAVEPSEDVAQAPQEVVDEAPKEADVAEPPKEAEVVDGAAADADAEAVVDTAVAGKKDDAEASVSEEDDIARAKKTQVHVLVFVLSSEAQRV